ncbi:hypothetical protein HOC35_07255 [Candidatus Woesearchaeota archaeon]|jgi:hypothetical protein|nr:hypothetical protein [Candidatus Woesearchaeota archaeon]
MVTPSTALAMQGSEVIDLARTVRDFKTVKKQGGLGLKLFPRILESLLRHYKTTYFESIGGHVLLDPLPYNGRDYVLEDALEETRDFCSTLEGKVIDGVMVERAVPMTLQQFSNVHKESRQHALDLTLPQFKDKKQNMYFTKWILDFLDKIPVSDLPKDDSRFSFYRHMQHMPLLFDTSIKIKSKYKHEFVVYNTVPGKNPGTYASSQEIMHEPRLKVDILNAGELHGNVSIPGYSFYVTEFHKETNIPINCSRDITIWMVGGIIPSTSGESQLSHYLSMSEEIRKGEVYAAMSHLGSSSHTVDTIDLSNLITTKRSDFSVPIVLYEK